MSESKGVDFIQQSSVVEQVLHVRLHVDAGDTVVSKTQQLCSHRVPHLLRSVGKQKKHCSELRTM